MDVDRREAAPRPIQADADRLTFHVRQFGALSALVATPVNLVMTLIAGGVQNPSGTRFLGFVNMPQLALFLISCYCFLGGCASVIAVGRIPVSPRGMSVRKVLLGVVVAGTASVPVVTAIVWHVL